MNSSEILIMCCVSYLSFKNGEATPTSFDLVVLKSQEQSAFCIHNRIPGIPAYLDL